MSIEDQFNFNDTYRSQLIQPNMIFDKSLYEYDKLINELKKKFRVKIFIFEKIFENYTSMRKFIDNLSEIFQTKYNKNFKIEDFNPINQSTYSDIEIKEKRIENFKLNNAKIYDKLKIKEDYFNKIYSKKFLIKFKKMVLKKNKIYFSNLGNRNI